MSDELVDPVAQLGLSMLREQTISRQPIVSEAPDALDRLTAQDRDDVSDSKSLIDADHARQDFLGDDRRINNFLDVAQTEVAGAAVRRRVVLAEVTDQCPMPADRAACIAIHLVDEPEWGAAL